MGQNLHTVAALDPMDPSDAKCLVGYFRQIFEIVRRNLEFRPLALASPPPPGADLQSWYQRGIDTQTLFEDGVEARLQGLKELNGGFDVKDGEKFAGGNFHLSAPNTEEASSTLPPWMKGPVHLDIGWDEGFWLGDHFDRSEYLRIYADLLRSIRKELNPSWLIDGPTAISGWPEERFARFIYYRKPDDFARSLCEIHGLEGDLEAIVNVLRDLVERDVIMQWVHYQKPRLAEREALGRPSGPFKRLRFEDDGGIVLENGRYGTDSNDYWVTGTDLQPVVADHLIRAGVARPAAAAKPTKA